MLYPATFSNMKHDIVWRMTQINILRESAHMFYTKNVLAVTYNNR